MPNAKSQRLVIVESPAKAKTISGYLGPGYVVEASYGPVLLAVLAAGLLCYALFCFAEARYRRV